MNAGALEHCIDFAVKPAPLDEARAGSVAAIESDAFGDAGIVDQRRLLVDNGDPELGRMLRREDRGDVALLDRYGGAVGLVDAAQDLGEGRPSASSAYSTSLLPDSAMRFVRPCARVGPGDDRVHGDVGPTSVSATPRATTILAALLTA